MKTFFSLFLCLFVTLTTVHADTAKEIKTRMSVRLPAVAALKTSGKLGEANTGLLVKRGSLTAAEVKTMTSENKDRGAVYALIAKKTGSSAAAVAKARAKSIRSNAAKGVWIQTANGVWKKAS